MSGDPVLAARAIYAFPRNLVLAASAGTGKTHALVGVAVHLLTGGCRADGGGLRPPIATEALLATTFSRKAAAEIRGRLHQALSRLATGDPGATYRDDLLAACVAAGEPVFSDAELTSRATTALRRLGRAQIGTLHSFATSIVRAHALLVGLSPDFDLPDEETARERSRDALEATLERRAHEPEIGACIQLAGGVVETVAVIQRLLDRLAEEGRAPDELELDEGDAASIERDLQTALEHATDVAGDPRLGGPATDVLRAYRDGRHDALEQAMGDLWSVPRQGKLSESATRFFDARDAMAQGAAGAKLADRGRVLVRAWLVRDRLLPRSRAFRGLLVECQAEVDAANTRDSVLGFADVLRAARDVLRDHPAVAAEAGSPLEALLLDEFQDTSGVQRDLVQLLWEADRRGAGLRPAGVVPPVAAMRPQGLLIVGDRKQSIYAFRGANVAVFSELCVGLAGAPAREALAIPPEAVGVPSRALADFIPLRDNRRGAPELLDFANAYSRLSLQPERRPAELYEITYSPSAEDLRPPGEERALDGPPRTHWLRPPILEGKLSPSLLAEAEVMAARISAIVRGGELTVRGAPARWRDVAILAPRHQMLAAAAYCLAQAGIPHVVAGMGFFGAAEVRDMMAMLACLVDPDDSLARAEVLRSPWAGATDRALVGLTDHHAGIPDVDHWSVGERRGAVDAECRGSIRALAQVITALREVIGRVGPGPALREAVQALWLEETLILLPRGEQRVANVRKLLALADGATDGWELLRRLRRAADREQREGEAETFSDDDDAVRLLTVHGSKGLAFPVVFLPEAGAIPRAGPYGSIVLQPGVAGGAPRLSLRVLDGQGTVIDTPSYVRAKRDLARRDLAERLRLRYVAMTRASAAMYFVGDRAVPKGPRDAYEASTAAILARLAETEASRREAKLDVETGASLYRAVDASTETGAPPPLEPRRRESAPLRDIVVDARTIRLAAHCVRRSQISGTSYASSQSHLRPPAEVARDVATLGRWGEAVVREGATIHRAEAVSFVTRSSVASGSCALTVQGLADIAVLHGEDVDLLCVLEPTLDPTSDELFASLLVHGSARGSRTSKAARVGLIPPEVAGEPRPDPAWQEARDAAWTDLTARRVVARMVAVARDELAPRVPVSVCLRVSCPHVAGCYPGRTAAQAPDASAHRQTAFEFFDSDRDAGRRRSRRRG